MVEFKIHTTDKVVSPEEFQKNLKKKNKFPSIIDKKTKKEFPPTKEALDTSKKERTKLSNEKLANMTNREFLGISRARRLENITKNNIKSEKVADRTQKHLEFTFTFNGIFNKELYLKTTAGQVLPKEVASVECDGITYKRNNLSGEFFAGGNKRLLIKEGTKIDITKFRSEDDITKLQEANKAQYNKFKETKDYNAGLDDIVSEAIKRGIDPKFAILAFGDKVKDMPMLDLKRSILIEEMFTQYDRIKGGISLAYDNSDKGLQVLILKEFGGDKWEEKAKEYGINKVNIKEFKNKVSNGNGILEVLKGDLKTKTVNFIKKEEGFYKKPYWDYKQWTHGYGTKAKGPNDYITRASAAKELEYKINRHYNLSKELAKRGMGSLYSKLNENQIVSLTSFIFNLGPGKLTSIKKQLQSFGKTGNVNVVANKMLIYNKAGGKTLGGLVKRRRREANLFLS